MYQQNEAAGEFDPDLSTMEAIHILDEEGANSMEKPEGEITSLPIRQISRLISAFQPRSLIGNLSEDEEFTEGLVKALERRDGKPLDPITVWWSGRSYYVIDGHHRLLAYKKYWGPAAADTKIPCTEFIGNREEAMEFSGLANSKNKLPMREQDRSNYAWRLTTTTALSVSRVVNASGVGERTVKYMRKALRTILNCREEKQPEWAAPFDRELACLELGQQSWAEARLEAQGIELPEKSDWEVRKEMEAQKLAKRLQRQHGGNLHRRLDVFARALVIYNDTIPKGLVQSAAWEVHATQLYDILEMVISEQNTLEQNTDF